MQAGFDAGYASGVTASFSLGESLGRRLVLEATDAVPRSKDDNFIAKLRTALGKIQEGKEQNKVLEWMKGDEEWTEEREDEQDLEDSSTGRHQHGHEHGHEDIDDFF